MDLVSVIIPFYNEEKQLEKAILSVINQSYKNIELVLINDGSTKNSHQYVINFIAKFNNCKLISITNSGPGIARNIGVSNANGKYIAFLDSDDIYVENAIELLVNKIKKTDSDLVVGMHKMIDFEGEEINSPTHLSNKEITKNKAINLLLENKLIPTSWGKLYKLDLAKKCEFPNLFWKEDDVFMLQYINLCNSISFVNYIVLLNYCRPNSLTRQIISKKMITDISKSYQLQQQYLTTFEQEKIIFKSKINTYLNLLLILLIDWQVIPENKKEIKIIFIEKIKVLNKQAIKFNLSIKKRIVLFLMNSISVFGIKPVFFILKLTKKNQIITLKRIKK